MDTGTAQGVGRSQDKNDRNAKIAPDVMDGMRTLVRNLIHVVKCKLYNFYH